MISQSVKKLSHFSFAPKNRGTANGKRRRRHHRGLNYSPLGVNTVADKKEQTKEGESEEEKEEVEAAEAKYGKRKTGTKE